MATMKKRVVPLSSALLVTAAAAAILIDAAQAQQAPLRYGTNPTYTSAAPQELSFVDDDAPVNEIEHTVAMQETIYALSRIYGVRPAEIIEYNGFRPPYTLAVGQLVRIPMAEEREVSDYEQRQAAEPRRVVVDTAPLPSVPTPVAGDSGQRFALDTTYEVRQGDTLYSISRRFGLSVADIASVNRLQAPYTLALHQKLTIPGAGQRQAPQRVAQRQPQVAQQRWTTQPTIQQLPPQTRQQAAPLPRAQDQRSLSGKIYEETMSPRTLPEVASASQFAWPVRGPVLMDFGDDVGGGTRSDGISIAAPIGAPVRATADGEVVYRGDELDGYGNLLLVKHENGWVSAYAHTDAILVRKGDYVRQGQVIAKVGRTGKVDSPQLHFQLRKNLQPQDPIIAMQGELDGAAMTAASMN